MYVNNYTKQIHRKVGLADELIACLFSLLMMKPNTTPDIVFPLSFNFFDLIKKVMKQEFEIESFDYYYAPWNR